MRTGALAAVLVLAGTVAAEAQAPPAKFDYSTYYMRYYYNPVKILDSQYLQNYLKLTKEQKELLKRIDLQMAGARALFREDVVKELGITADQSKKIRAVYDDHFKRRAEITKSFRTDPQGAAKKYRELSNEYLTLDKKAFDVLTKQQMRRLDRMKGEEFDTKKLYPRPTPKKKPDV